MRTVPGRTRDSDDVSARQTDRVKRLRPLLVANFARVVGGGEHSLVELADGLTARGHRPLIAIPGRGDLGLTLAREHDRVLVPSSIPGLALALRALARDCDIIHTTGARGVAAAGLARPKVPVVWHVRVAARDRLDPVLARVPDLIIANSAATARRFATHPRVRVIHNGIRPPDPLPGAFPYPVGQRTIAVVGRMTPEKGHIDLVPAATALAREDPGISWFFAGDFGTPEGTRLRRELESGGVPFQFAGVVPGMAAHLARFQLVVVPSRIEGFGRVAAEALRAGTSVLARRVGGLVEVLDGVSDPWLPEDPASWAAPIKSRLDQPADDPDRLRALGARFDLDYHVAAVVEAYASLLG